MSYLGTQIISRQPMWAAGNSGAMFERVTLGDGRSLVRKAIRLRSDWMARVGEDHGRVLAWWQAGIFASMPATVDHTIEAVERTPDGGWDIYMRDVSDVLFPSHGRIGSQERQQLLRGIRAFHTGARYAAPPESCPIRSRYTMFSPGTAADEAGRGNPHGEIIGHGWEVFADVVEPAVLESVLTLAAAPDRLVGSLSRYQAGVVHGDLRLGNLGLADGALVLIDWGERIGVAPPAVDLAWLIGFDGHRLGASLDALLDEVLAVYVADIDPASLDLALLGAVVQLGGIIGHWIATARDDTDRLHYRAHLAWLAERALDVLEHDGSLV